MITALIVIAVVVAIILLYAATKPNSFRVSRTTNIHASAAHIFPLVNNLADHSRWSPFARDPKVNNKVSNPPDGEGARVDFDGSCAGWLVITDSAPPSRIEMRLVMTKPMKADNQVEFGFVSYGRDSTDVTWTMSGPQPYLGKLMSVFINCDKMVGKQFEQGLADLKKISEQPA
jgi:polyketide cyclase/dehydrase/lipid transport protein